MVGRRRISLLVTVSALVALTVSPGTAAALDSETVSPDATVYSPVFADTPDEHVFASPVRAVFAAGVTVGCNAKSTKFCPDDPVTRGQMAAFLSRALRLPAGETIDFTDDDGHLFENVIQRLATAGITRGCNPPANDQFCPDEPVTRGQMAAFLTRALDLPVPPAVPAGVGFDRTPADGVIGTRVNVCRDVEISLLVRSVSGGTSDLERVMSWEPSVVDATAGETDLASDVWYLPTGTGCETLEIAWDPRANVLRLPLSKLVIMSPFGYRRSPVTGETRLHAGTDLDGETGDQVFAAATGLVTFAGSNAELGRMIDIKHTGGLRTRYAHLSSVGVSVGDLIEAGETIGTVGCTGSCTGSHLHFGTFEFGVPVDPMSYLGN
jgi:hypothetical protein